MRTRRYRKRGGTCPGADCQESTDKNATASGSEADANAGNTSTASVSGAFANLGSAAAASVSSAAANAGEKLQQGVDAARANLQSVMQTPLMDTFDAMKKKAVEAAAGLKDAVESRVDNIKEGADKMFKNTSGAVTSLTKSAPQSSPDLPAQNGGKRRKSKRTRTKSKRKRTRR